MQEYPGIFLAIPEGPRGWIDKHGIQNYESIITFYG